MPVCHDPHCSHCGIIGRPASAAQQRRDSVRKIQKEIKETPLLDHEAHKADIARLEAEAEAFEKEVDEAIENFDRV